MNGESAVLEQVIGQALHLPPLQKVQLVEKLMEALKNEVLIISEQPQPQRSLYGLFSDLGPAPSEDEIDEVRREMWGNFPREDI